MFFCYSCQTRYPTRVGWCSVCLSSGTILVEPLRARSTHRSQRQVASARELVQRRWTLVESSAYPELAVSRGSLVAVWGAPGSGKSSWATRYADSLSGAAVYLSAEEALGPAVAARLERLGVTRADFAVVGQATLDEVVALCRDAQATSLTLDSVSVMPHLAPSDLRRLREAAGVAVLTYLLHATKAGDAAGRLAWLHEADAVVQVDAGRWTRTKDRHRALDGADLPVLPPRENP